MRVGEKSFTADSAECPKLMDYGDRIRGFIQSFCSLLYLGTANPRPAVARCMEIATVLSMEVYTYSLGEGLRKAGRETPKDGNIDPVEMLTRILDAGRRTFVGKRSLYLLEHADLLIENRDPVLLTKLRAVADSTCYGSATILLGRAGFELPEIIGDIPRITVSALSLKEIGGMVDTCQENLPRAFREEVIHSLSGLTALQCENLLALSLVVRKGLDGEFLRKERARLLSQRARTLIQLREPAGDLESVGGLNLLKAWLMKRGRHVCGLDHAANGLPPPKGVLLTGFPGCGKSFVAEAVAGSWGVPLVRMDPYRLFRSFVGETEQNFMEAFETVRSLAPVVLWIDELEKLFSRSQEQSADGGVLSRVLALFLDFLQSRRDGIFVCATANAIAGLPQEILRSGRFDAVFFIDLPNRKERKHILEILLKKYGLDENLRVTGELAAATEAFSGAELEQAVIECLHDQEGTAARVTEFALSRTIRAMVPLARTMGECFEAMREWSQTRARFASSPDDAGRKGGRRICHTSRR